MNVVGVAVLIAFLGISQVLAAEPKIPLATMTCKQFTDSPKDTVSTIVMWMMGYNQDPDEPPEIDFAQTEDLRKKLQSYCAQNPTHGIMAALDKVTEASNDADVLKSVVGLWTFPDKQVWIQVRPDGSALQCRIDPNGTVYLSKGTFRAPDVLAWEKNWGDDKVVRDKDAITLTGKFGAFTYKAETGGRPSERCMAS
jgi:HdeA/HdeB family